MGLSSAERESLACPPGSAFLRLVGFWQPQPQESASLYQPAARACLSLAAIAFVAVGAALKLFLDPPQNLEELALFFFVAVICSELWIRAILFIMHGSTLWQLVQLLVDAWAEHNQGEGNECTRRRYQRTVKRVSMFLQVGMLGSLAYWLSSPLVSRALLGSDNSSRQLPLPVWVPVDVHASPTYETLYTAQCIGLTIVTASTACMDIFFIHLMQLIGAEFEVLNENFSTMHKEHEQYAEAKKRGAIFECISDEKMHLQLTKNIQHHQTILRSVSLLQTAMSAPIFILLFINMANLCSNLFIAAVLLQRDRNFSKALKALMSIPPLLYETGLYCTFGHVLTDQSENLVQSAFSCDWADCDVRFRRSLLIFMTATVQPVELTMGGMTKLSKQTLLQVLNGTYGLLNMLYHFHTNL